MTNLPQIAPPAAPRQIAFICFDGAQSLDVVGPMEVFTKANAHHAAPRPAYRVLLASPRGGEVQTNGGLRLAGTLAIADLPTQLDTIVLAGGNEAGVRRMAGNGEVVRWLQARATDTARLASVCTGAFILGAAGLLQGRRATTHWKSCEALQAACPDVRVQADAIYVADPPIYTSAGITTGIDLCLSLVEDDCGSATALAVARDLVLFMRRPGDQAQFSSALKLQLSSSSRVSSLVAAVLDDPTGDLGISALAARAGMSERTFVRRFRSETGTTPAQFVQQVRLERAKTLLTTTPTPLDRIAEHAGFASLDSLHRAFLRHLKITPTAYRRYFGPRATNAG